MRLNHLIFDLPGRQILFLKGSNITLDYLDTAKCLLKVFGKITL